MSIVFVISFDVFGNSRQWASINGIFDKLLTANSCFFVHCQDHSFPGLFIINFRYLRSHNVNRTKNYFTLLLSTVKTEKNLFNTVGFSTTLICKKILRSPAGALLSDYS